MGYPTLLASLAARRHWTSADAIAAFGEASRSMNSTYVVSERQWERWRAGEIKRLPRPLCCRILEHLFEHSVNELFAPPPLMTPMPPRAVPSEGDHAYWREPYETRPGPTAHEEIVTVADDSAQFTRRIRRVDEHTLDQFDADVGQLAVEYLRRPPYVAFRHVAELRNEVFTVLDSRHPLDQERRLYLVVGKLCALLAHISADLNHPYEAETHIRTALVCAELTEDNRLRSYARWVQSNVAYWRGDYRRAADIANTARETATTGSDMLRLVSQQARAVAAMQDRSEFSRVIAAAIDVREAGTETELIEEPGVFRFSTGKAAYYASEAYHAMGSREDLQHAQEHARESVYLLSTDPNDQGPSLLAAVTLDLVAAQLTAGELDGAAESLRGVLDTRPELRTVPVVQRVQRIDKQLALTESTPLILDLREQTMLFIAHPAVTPEIPGR